MHHKFIMALPKGRLLDDCIPLLKRINIIPEPSFFAPDTRQYHFKTNHETIELIIVRSFDVATFVASGAASWGIVGNDVLAEFEYDELYAPLDLNMGHCRLSLAYLTPISQKSHICVATKYPHITTAYFAQKGVQAECIKLSGSIEIAPHLNMCDCIVDLVSTGTTLKQHNLIEGDTLMKIAAKLIVNRIAYKTHYPFFKEHLDELQKAI